MMKAFWKFFASVFLLVSLTIASTQLALAVDLSITTYPTSVNATNQFDVAFTASGLTPDSVYNAKGLGGDGFNEVSTWNNGSWLQQNASWSSMPSFTADGNGNATVNITVRFDSTTQTGSKEFKVRINKSTNYDSPVVNIAVTAVTPTPSPSPTPNPTATSTASSSPTPTATPTKTPTPKPTVTKSPTPVASPSDEPSPTPIEEILETTPPELLGLSTESTPEGNPTVQGTQTINFPVIAILLIVSGIACVGVPIVWSIRRKIKYNDPTGENT